MDASELAPWPQALALLRLQAVLEEPLTPGLFRGEGAGNWSWAFRRGGCGRLWSAGFPGSLGLVRGL